MTASVLDRQAALPRSIPLFRHAPERVHFSWRELDPAVVQSAEDLPQYLILGGLDPESFTRSEAGWSARWQGTEADTHFDVDLDRLAARNPGRAALIEAATDELEEALSAVAKAQTGEGWSTGGMLGGQGYTVCVPDPATLDALADECRTIVGACAMAVRTEDSGEAGLPRASPRLCRGGSNSLTFTGVHQRNFQA